MSADLFSAEQKAVAFAHVAVERSVDRYPEGLTYAIPESLADLAPGERVVVPLGRGDAPTPGYVVDVRDECDLDAQAVKFIAERDDTGVSLPDELMRLARWMAAYYCAPMGMALAAILPAAVKRQVGATTQMLVDLGEPMPLDRKLPPKQRLVLETLARLPADARPVEERYLRELAGVKTRAPLMRLVDAGLLDVSRRTVVSAAWTRHMHDDQRPERLTDAQARAVDTLGAALDRGFSAHLLYGVTGSGKTEVYLQLIERTIAAGRVAMLLVPEISLTPQTGGRLLGRFPDRRIAVLHSGLTAAQRHQHWRMVADGAADIVVGARSAVFAPIPDDRLGLIVVDEEHDSSYKQDQAPRYHGRDVAVRRAQIADCPVLLGSATPSLESWHNATTRGAYALHRLPERVAGGRLPRVDVLDFVEQARQHEDRRIHLIGPMLEHAIERTLTADGQLLLLLNRRGYANYIACPDLGCGWIKTCDHCDVTMVYHLHGAASCSAASATNAPAGYIQCHHCLAEQKLPAECPQCGNRIVTFGLGTQRVEEELQRKFPALIDGKTMLRVDSDAMHGVRDFHDALERFGRGDVKALVGTQMIAKGLDYPNVRLVGVINADTAINLPDFRAAERTFQLVNQVAGRSGRGEHVGRVIVQTFNPESAAIRFAASHDYEGFAAHELSTRRACGLPPFGRMVRIVVRDEDFAACVAAGRAVLEGLRNLLESGATGEHAAVRLRGPHAPPIARLAGRHRQQIEILAPDATTVQRLLAAARNTGTLRAGSAMVVDVDPVALL